MQDAFCRAPNGGRRGRLSHRRMARSLRRIARMDAHLDAPLGPPSVTSRKRRSPAWEWAAQKHLRVGKAKRARVGKTAIPGATQKRQRRSPRDASRQIYFIAWVVCAREMMTS